MDRYHIIMKIPIRQVVTCWVYWKRFGSCIDLLNADFVKKSTRSRKGPIFWVHETNAKLSWHFKLSKMLQIIIFPWSRYMGLWTSSTRFYSVYCLFCQYEKLLRVAGVGLTQRKRFQAPVEKLSRLLKNSIKFAKTLVRGACVGHT